MSILSSFEIPCPVFIESHGVYLCNILAGKLKFLYLHLTEDPTQIGYKNVGIYSCFQNDSK